MQQLDKVVFWGFFFRQSECKFCKNKKKKHLCLSEYSQKDTEPETGAFCGVMFQEEGVISSYRVTGLMDSVFRSCKLQFHIYDRFPSFLPVFVCTSRHTATEYAVSFHFLLISLLTLTTTPNSLHIKYKKGCQCLIIII